MKRLVLLIVICVSALIVSAGAQSVVDAARASRARQKANPNAKVIDNDVIPSAIDASSYTSPYASARASDDKKDDSSAKKDAAKDENKTGDKTSTADDDQKNIDSWMKLINDEKKEIRQLERELNVAQREAGVRSAVYYADAGTMLRDSAKYAEDNRKLQAEIETKTQALASAKQKLADLEEQARKAGVPSSRLD
ncbi:MAG TPA: hypothetical protein VKD65_07220 [Candidatus Angelobacter sp.]|nr:hypothetical protein [Candidatus Angelobacter sp.]